MSKMIRISPDTDNTLDQLAKQTGMSKKMLTEQAIKKLAREKLFELAGQAYEQVRSNPTSRKEEQDEQKLWDSTLLDGLDNDKN